MSSQCFDQLTVISVTMLCSCDVILTCVSGFRELLIAKVRLGTRL